MIMLISSHDHLLMFIIMNIVKVMHLLHSLSFYHYSKTNLVKVKKFTNDSHMFTEYLSQHKIYIYYQNEFGNFEK